MRLETLHRLPGHLIRRLNQISGAIFAERVGAEDITSVQFAALVAIASTPEATARSVSALIAFDPATIGGVIDRLEAKDLVVRSPSGSDRRAKHLKLTKAGLALVARVASDVMRVQDDLLAPLSEAERTRFMELLEKLVRTPRADLGP